MFNFIRIAQQFSKIFGPFEFHQKISGSSQSCQHLFFSVFLITYLFFCTLYIKNHTDFPEDFYRYSTNIKMLFFMIIQLKCIKVFFFFIFFSSFLGLLGCVLVNLQLYEDFPNILILTISNSITLWFRKHALYFFDPLKLIDLIFWSFWMNVLYELEKNVLCFYGVGFSIHIYYITSIICVVQIFLHHFRIVCLLFFSFTDNVMLNYASVFVNVFISSFKSIFFPLSEIYVIAYIHILDCIF